MRIISCCKAVPEEQDIIVTKDRQLSLSRAEWKFGQYDLNAVEAGKQIIETVGGKLSGLVVGGSYLDNPKLKKDILSRGLDDLYLVMDEQTETDTYQTAAILKAAIMKMGDFDLILCGAGSSDLYAQETGNQLGELLGIPVVNAVNKITVQGEKAVVERMLENEIQVLEIPLPAVLSVTSEINTPRIAGMRDIIAARKKPLTQFTLAEIGLAAVEPSGRILSTLAPGQVDRRLDLLEGESDEVIDDFVKKLIAELK
ncbi:MULTISPECIES: electron transfer flavoprotein [unclassified Sporolactobacillus]|uniref:electron transfer flavoprotein n=1 Tax=unclassified Sporolactobacillus TaxID=2628533 RepID=UPI002367DBC7|nr:electron transfer flavoprotein [Sporolactobacillus sp. CQH2019]MDD9150086.1 electron transfer flavoprotein [Sporolactobacillus sp. CQH2019]